MHRRGRGGVEAVRLSALQCGMNKPNEDRRSFLKTGLAVGVGISALGALAGSAWADEAAMDPVVSKPGAAKPVTSEAIFRKGVIGPAELSLAASKLAVDKATQANAKEFAGFELTEAIAVTTVLKDLGTPVPEPDAKAKETLETLQSAAKGADFDKAYIKAQLENHEFLRDHAMAYLKNASADTSDAGKQGQHLATLALATFKEHVAICQRIATELGA